jgi:hypothetical protein
LTLPDGVKVLVEERKVRDYLLSSTHPIARLKAAFFGTLGFGPENPRDLENALEEHASGGRVVDRSGGILRLVTAYPAPKEGSTR